MYMYMLALHHACIVLYVNHYLFFNTHTHAHTHTYTITHTCTLTYNDMIMQTAHR